MQPAQLWGLPSLRQRQAMRHCPVMPFPPSASLSPLSLHGGHHLLPHVAASLVSAAGVDLCRPAAFLERKK